MIRSRLRNPVVVKYHERESTEGLRAIRQRQRPWCSQHSNFSKFCCDCNSNPTTTTKNARNHVSSSGVSFFLRRFLDNATPKAWYSSSSISEPSTPTPSLSLSKLSLGDDNDVVDPPSNQPLLLPIEEFLKQPLGSMSHQDRRKGMELLQQWLSASTSDSASEDTTSLSSLLTRSNITFQLLDRLAQEEEEQRRQNEQQQQHEYIGNAQAETNVDENIFPPQLLSDAVYQWRQEWARHQQQPQPPPMNLSSYSSLSSSIPLTPQQVWKIVLKYNSKQNPNQQLLTTRLCNTILEGCLATTKSNHSNEEKHELVAPAIQIVDFMQNNYNPGEHGCSPDSKTYNLLLKIQCQHWGPDLPGLLQVLDYLLDQKKQYEHQKDHWIHNIHLNAHFFEYLLQACANLPVSNQRGFLADEVLRRMVYCHDAGILLQTYRVEHFTHVMHIWVQSGHSDAGPRALGLFNYMKQLANAAASASEDNHKINTNRRRKFLEPDTHMIGTVLHALARSGKAELAEKLLQDTCQQYLALIQTDSRQDAKRIQPNLPAFNHVLAAWANVKQREAGIRAEKVLLYMQRVASRQWPVQPNNVSFTSVIQAWAISGHPKAGQRAEQLFEELRRKAKDNVDHRITAKSSSLSQQPPPPFQKLQPNARTYAALMNAWAKSGNADRASDVLARMCTEYKSGNSSVEPTHLHFGIVLDAMARSSSHKNPNVGPKAEQLLQKMKMASNYFGKMEPTTICYNSVIHAYARSCDRFAGVEAERLLREMRSNDVDSRPDRQTYNSVMNAYARSNALNGGQQAERILREQQQVAAGINRHDEGPNTKLKPNSTSYNTVLNGYAKRGQTDHAERLFQEMLASFDPQCQPDVVTISTMIDAWASSESPIAGEKADFYLNLQQEKPRKGFLIARLQRARTCWQHTLEQADNDAQKQQAASRLKQLSTFLDELRGPRAQKYGSPVREQG